MKIVIDFRMHNSSGIGTYIRNIVPFLIEEFDIILLGPSKEVRKYDFCNDVEIIDATSKIYSIMEQIELITKISKCDLFWSPHYNVPAFPIRAKRRMVTIHDVFHLAFCNTLNWKQKIYAKFMINQAVAKSDAILTVSEFSKREILKYITTDKEIYVVYNGIDSSKFKVIYDKKVLNKIRQKYSLPEKFILFVGNVKPHKNLKNLLLAIRDLDTNLVIVGKRDGFITSDGEIEKIIKNQDFKNKVFITGYVEENDLPIIYNLAELFVFPSLYEGFGIPPLEAMACGTPVVISNVASLPEVCGDAVYYVDPYNVESIANGIKTTLENEFLQKKLIQKGFERVKLFSWEKSARKIIEIIKRYL